MPTAFSQPLVAYFSMEMGLDPRMPTYAGGLGVLAGDTIRSAADPEIPLIGVSLLHRHGYFRQAIDQEGRQTEAPVPWPLKDFLQPVEPVVQVEIYTRSVEVRAWRYRVRGWSGFEAPVYLLETDLSENSEWDRTLTDQLYGGDADYRLCQEVVLGYGGLRMLRALGYTDIPRYHLNEGHAALLVLALIEGELTGGHKEAVIRELLERVRQRCVFTTHTPVPAGHDQFGPALARRVLGERRCASLSGCLEGEALNMTLLALRGAGYINGVAMKHGEVSASQFPGYPIHSITNGVHTVGGSGVSVPVRPPPAGLAPRSTFSPVRHQHPEPRNMGGARRGEASLDRLHSRGNGHKLRSPDPDYRLRQTGYGL